MAVSLLRAEESLVLGQERLQLLERYCIRSGALRQVKGSLRRRVSIMVVAISPSEVTCDLFCIDKSVHVAVSLVLLSGALPSLVDHVLF